MLDRIFLSIEALELSEENFADQHSLPKARNFTLKFLNQAYKTVKYFAEKDYLEHHKHKDKESKKNVFTNFSEANIKIIASKFKEAVEAVLKLKSKTDYNGINQMEAKAFRLVQFTNAPSKEKHVVDFHEASARDKSPLAVMLRTKITYIKDGTRKTVDENIYNLLKYLRVGIAAAKEHFAKIK